MTQFLNVCGPKDFLYIFYNTNSLAEEAGPGSTESEATMVTQNKSEYKQPNYI